MNVDEWTVKIKNDCAEAATYKPAFDATIKTLASVLARRDEVAARYEAEGSEPVLVHTNKVGDEIARANPLLTLWNTLNTTALSYWKELGLTPSGLKKINENAMKPKRKNLLSEALKELGDA